MPFSVGVSAAMRSRSSSGSPGSSGVWETDEQREIRHEINKNAYETNLKNERKIILDKIFWLLVIKYLSENYTKKNAEGEIIVINDSIKNLVTNDINKLIETLKYYIRGRGTTKPDINNIFFISLEKYDKRKSKYYDYNSDANASTNKTQMIRQNVEYSNKFFLNINEKIQLNNPKNDYEYYNIIYLNAYKNCGKNDNKETRKKLFDYDYLAYFLKVIDSVNNAKPNFNLKIPEFNQAQILKAIENTSIFNDKKIKDQTRKGLCNTTNAASTEIEKNNYKTILKAIAEIIPNAPDVNALRALKPTGSDAPDVNSLRALRAHKPTLRGGHRTSKSKHRTSKSKQCKTRKKIKDQTLYFNHAEKYIEHKTEIQNSKGGKHKTRRRKTFRKRK